MNGTIKEYLTYIKSTEHLANERYDTYRSDNKYLVDNSNLEDYCKRINHQKVNLKQVKQNMKAPIYQVKADNHLFKKI